jgi:hypothetical protein
MTHGTVHEEAEHASHHSHDPFDRRVAMTMVVVAALLAGVKILGHRAHNDTLSYQIKANMSESQESDKWNHYQAKKNRQYLYGAQADVVTVLGQKRDNSPVGAEVPDNLVVAADPHGEKPKEGPKPKKKTELSDEDRKKVEDLVKKGLSQAMAERVVLWQSDVQRYEQETANLEKEAHDLEHQKEEDMHRSEHQHHQAAYFDLGELFVELALVLCSVAILTKLPGFWYGGSVVCAVGLVVVAVGWFAH